jgi:protein-S-isoprenylcysteine O-methyltransferase Ste14
MTEFVSPQPSLDLTPDRAPIEASASTRPVSRLSESHPWLEWLANPWADKFLAIAAVLPFVYPTVMHFRHHFRLGELVYLGQILIIIGTMAFRRLPVRISANPYYWVVAFVASYWGLFLLSVEQPGRRLIHSTWLFFILYILSIAVDVWGRLSLGRNIAVLPAQRQIVERGAYRWMRHPIYTAALLALLGGILGSYSLQNLLLYMLGVVWFAARSLAEENFLRKDPAYAAYMLRVPWRWFPGLI